MFRLFRNAFLASLVALTPAGLVSTSVLVSTSALADEAPQTHILRIRTVAPKASPWGVLIVKIAKAIKAESGGRIKIKVYWQSKSEPSAIRQCLSGKIGGVAVSNGALAAAVPELEATEMPFVFDDYKQVDKAFAAAAPLMREVMERRGFIFAIRGENGFRSFAHKSMFFTSPDQLAGQKMRSQPARHHLDFYEALGATPSPVQTAEVPSALSNNVVSGYDNTLLFGYLANWSEEITYVTLTKHIYQGALIAWCKPWFDKLPADLQAILTKDRPKIEKLGLGLVRAFNDDKVPAKYEESGKQMKALTSSQRAAFRKATASVEAKFLARASDEGKELLKVLKGSR